MFITILPLVLMILVIARLYFLNKNYEPTISEMREGNVCYSCKSDIDKTEPQFSFNNFLKELDGEDFYTLCKSCKRNDKLNVLTSNTLKNKIEVLNLYIYRNHLIITKIALLFMIIFLISDWTIFYFTNVNPNMNAYYNTLYWIFTAYKQEISYRRKKLSII
jgi:hypothetical protein